MIEQETCAACERGIDRDLMIAAMRQENAKLRTENQQLRRRIAEVIRVLGKELQERW